MNGVLERQPKNEEGRNNPALSFYPFAGDGDMEKDIRVLCYSCLEEYRRAGYSATLIWSKTKEECDVCRIKYGWQYEIKRVPRGRYLKK